MCKIDPQILTALQEGQTHVNVSVLFSNPDDRDFWESPDFEVRERKQVGHNHLVMASMAISEESLARFNKDPIPVKMYLDPERTIQ